jgi:thioredoxin reductase (NADPH)
MVEAMACQGEEVYMVGGANSAGQAAVFFARYASKVVMLVRGDSLASSMSRYLIDQIAATPTIEVRSNTRLVEVHGETSLQAVTLANSRTGETETAPAKSLFIFIGAEPRTDWLAGIVERDAHGFIMAGADLAREGRGARPLDPVPSLLATSVPGIFVAGDVRSGSIKRVASSVGEGSIAVQLVHRYLATL